MSKRDTLLTLPVSCLDNPEAIATATGRSMSTSQTNYGPSLLPFWGLIEECGEDPARLFQAAEIDPAVIRDENSRVDFSRVVRIWRWIHEHATDPCIGLRVVNHWHPSAGGALGYAWLASSTLRTALRRLVRYHHMINQGLDIRLRDDPGGRVSLVVAFHDPGSGVSSWMDAILAQVVNLCRINYGDELPLVEVALTHDEPECAGKFFGYFRCPVRFAADENRVTLTAAVVDRPLTGAHARLAHLHDRFVIDYLAGLEQGNLVERVKQALIERLPSGDITDAAIASALHMHERTLQRYLRQEGTTFKNILNEVREELAIRYLRDENLSLGEISFLLGFTEISSFSRAFKRWTGMPPSDFRAAAD